MFDFWIWIGKKLKKKIVEAYKDGIFSILARFVITVIVLPFVLGSLVHPWLLGLFIPSYFLNVVYQVEYLKEKKEDH